MKKTWNIADKVLLGIALLFLCMLLLHRFFPGNIFFQAILFITEAALVGGIADWFAVTALFRKPLGFPYHTAILPKRRREFSAATVYFIEKEIFSRRRLFAIMKSYDWKSWFIRELKETAVQKELREGIHSFVCDMATDFDCQRGAERVTKKFQEALRQIPLEDILSYMQQWLHLNHNDQRLLRGASTYLYEKMAHPDVKAKIQTILQDMQQRKIEQAGVWGAVLSSVSEAMDIVNVKEMALLIQQEILKVLKEFGERNSILQSHLLQLFYQQLELCKKDPSLQDSYKILRDQLAIRLPLADVTEAGLKQIQGALVGNPSPASEEFHQMVITLIEDELARCMKLLEENAEMTQKLDEVVYDIVARSALQAKVMSGLIARGIMERMTDEQLNHIVYSKIESDMLWIRMNGSIMGTLIGGILFCLMLLSRQLSV